MVQTAEQVIKIYGLEAHTEGGFFRQTHKSDMRVIANFKSPSNDSLSLSVADNQHNSATRSACTAILYMLPENDFSAFHKLDATEIWNYHAGRPLKIHILNPETKTSETHVLGIFPRGELSLVIKPDTWFAAELMSVDECKEVEALQDSDEEYSLHTCIVSPGFEFKGFKMIHTQEGMQELIEEYPSAETVIRRLTKLRDPQELQESIERDKAFQSRTTSLTE
jgi:predicted cupin superfamily sugar epimerase